VRIVLLGPPGAGKGTQAYRLASHYDLPLIATGDIFRRNVVEGTPLGLEAQRYMDAGELVPDDVVVKMVVAGLQETPGGFILDGFPRTIAQGEALEHELEREGQPLTAALALVVDDEVAVKRLAGRRTCERCQRPYNVELHPTRVEGICDRCGNPLVQRSDDEEMTVRHRIEVYHRSTQPLLSFYADRGKLLEVDAMGTEDEVSERAADLLAHVAGGQAW
jgi:adenylate kinase